MQPCASIFKAYDIRGIVDDTLDFSVVHAIGQALGLVIHRAGAKVCVIGRDGRLSGPTLSAALGQGLMDAGIDVIDIGCVPTPVVYFATVKTGSGCGVALTGSHNPAQYNGLKIMVDGKTLWGEAITELRSLIVSGQALAHCSRIVTASRGTITQMPEIAQHYLQAIGSRVRLSRPMSVAVDAGNGVAGGLGPTLLESLGCTVHRLFCEIDGRFPNHHPDPAHPENLRDLMNLLRNSDAEIGLAFDGDGDRLGVVTKSGQIIWPDRQLMLYAADVLASHPGAPIIYDVKCSRHVGRWIKEHGGVPMMWKTGHSLIKAKLRETGAPLAGEMSGHVFFNDNWYGFDDALYVAARLLAILSRSEDPQRVLESLPDSPSTPELQIHCAEGENVRLVDRLREEGVFPSACSRITIDGIRVEYEDGFGLARPSNTTPVIVLRFEADGPKALARIQAEFSENLRRIMPHASLPF